MIPIAAAPWLSCATSPEAAWKAAPGLRMTLLVVVAKLRAYRLIHDWHESDTLT